MDSAPASVLSLPSRSSESLYRSRQVGSPWAVRWLEGHFCRLPEKQPVDEEQPRRVRSLVAPFWAFETCRQGVDSAYRRSATMPKLDPPEAGMRPGIESLGLPTSD